jgi:DNA replication protein DnaC
MKLYPRKLTAKRLKLHGVDEAYHHVTLAAIPNFCDHKKIIERWIARVGEALEHGLGMVFFGEPRQGKTGSAVICLKAALAAGAEGYFIRADGIARSIMRQDTWPGDSDETEELYMERCDVLVIDDLGQGAGKEQADSMTERLVRVRADLRKVTLVTTNTMELMRGRLGAATAQMLMERGGVVRVENTPFAAAERNRVKEFFKE